MTKLPDGASQAIIDKMNNSISKGIRNAEAEFKTAMEDNDNDSIFTMIIKAQHILAKTAIFDAVTQNESSSVLNSKINSSIFANIKEYEEQIHSFASKQVAYMSDIEKKLKKEK